MRSYVMSTNTLNEGINLVFTIVICAACLGMTYTLVDRDASWIAHLANVWFFTTLYGLISYKTNGKEE